MAGTPQPPHGLSVALFFFVIWLSAWTAPSAQGQTVRAAPMEIDHAEIVLEMRDELQKRGVELIVLRLPVREELYETAETPHTEPLPWIHPNTIEADRRQVQLQLQGVKFINLYETYRTRGLEQDIFAEDRFHLHPAHTPGLAEELMAELYAQGVVYQDDGPNTIVFFGACFAESFADEVEELNGYDEVRKLVKYGGGQLAHNHLLAFADDVLAEADVAVWAFTDRQFRNPNFAEVEAVPVQKSGQELTTELVEARIVGVTHVSPEEVNEFEYPNAIRATKFQRLDTEETFIGFNYIARNRRLQRTAKYEEGFQIRLSITDLDQYFLHNPDVASEYQIDEINDFFSPRFWIKGWLDLQGQQVIEIVMEER